MAKGNNLFTQRGFFLNVFDNMSFMYIVNIRYIKNGDKI